MKYVHFLSASLLCFVAQNTTAQVEFFKTYGLPNRTEQLVGIRPAAASGQYWVAGTTGSVGHDDWFITLLDSSGQQLQADTFGSALHNELLYDFDHDPTTGVWWLAGSRQTFDAVPSQPMLWAVNAEGQTLAQVLLPSGWSGNYAYKMVRALGDGGALAVSSTDGSAHTLQRFGPTGNQLWEKPFSQTAFIEPAAYLAAHPDGRSYLLRNFNTYNPSTRRLELYHLDASGTVLWTKSIANPGGELSTFGEAVAIDPTDGNVLLLHYQRNPWKWFLSKLDPAGTLIWQQELATPLSGNWPARLATGANGTVGIVFKEEIEVRSSSTGAFLSNKIFAPAQGFTATYYKGGVLRSDGSMVLAANVERNAGSGDGYFARFSLPDYAVLAENYIGREGVNDYDSAPRVEVDAAGNWYVGNRADYGAAKNGDFALRKTDAAGNLLWEQHYGTEAYETFGDLALLADGHLLMTGSADRLHDTLPDYLVLLQLDPDGAVLWERRFPKKNLNPNVRTVALPDGGAVVLFNSQLGTLPTSGNQTQALGIAANGDTLWQRHYFQNLTEAHNRSSNQFTALPDGTLLSVGNCSNCTGSVLRLNPSDGAMILGKDIEIASNYHGRRATGGVLAANGDLLVMSINYSHLDSVYLYRLSPSGNVLQRKGLKIGEYHYASSLLRLSDGGLAAIIEHHFANYANTPDGLFVRRLSEAFEPLGADLVLANVDRRPEDAVALPGGGLALVGYARPTNSEDVFLLKTSAVPTVSTADVGGTDDGLLVFPNPVAKGGTLNISLGNDFIGTLRFDFIALDGRVLETFFANKTSDGLTLSQPITTAPAAFFVRVSDGKRSAVRLVLRGE
jgi:hypothetical protein